MISFFDLDLDLCPPIDPVEGISYSLAPMKSPNPESYTFHSGPGHRALISTRAWGNSGPSGEAPELKQGFLHQVGARGTVLSARQEHGLRVHLFRNLGKGGVLHQIWEGSWEEEGFTRVSGAGVALVHEGEVQSSKLAGLELRGDGIVTDLLDFHPGVTVADCLPLMLCAYGSGLIVRAMLHSGWPGTGILAVAIHAMRKGWDLAAEAMELAIGPGICAACYAIGGDRAELLRQRFGNDPIGETRGRGEFAGTMQASFDMRRANRIIASRLGLGRVSVSPICTFEDRNLFSHRRQSLDGGDPGGRNFALSLIKEP